MDEFLDPNQYDLATPDGSITEILLHNERSASATVFIQNISPKFVGFEIDVHSIFFNIKSTLAQLGVNGIGKTYELDLKNQCAQVHVQLDAFGPYAIEMLKLLQVGSAIGKLFAADERRRVRDRLYCPHVWTVRSFWQTLLSLGGLHGSNDLILDKVDGRTVAYLTLQNGRIVYDASIYGFFLLSPKRLWPIQRCVISCACTKSGKHSFLAM